MTSPTYVSDLASVYTQMYNPPGRERPLNEKFAPSTLTNREVEDDEDDPDWKKLIRKHAKKQKRHMAPTVADASKDDIPDAYEGEEEVVEEHGVDHVRVARVGDEREHGASESGDGDGFCD